MNSWITFDLDGTLMQNPFAAWIFPEITNVVREQLRNGIDVDDDAGFDMGKLLYEEHRKRMEAGKTVRAYDWDDMLRQVLAELGAEQSIDIQVEQLVRKHAVPPTKVYLLEEGVKPVLEQLSQHGYRLAVATNGYYKYQFPVLEALGIAQYFERIVTPETAGGGKPDMHMLHAVRQHGSIAAHVGDRLDHDVYMANQFGTASILVHRKLPQELQQLAPEQRMYEPAFVPICSQQLQRESQSLYTKLFGDDDGKELPEQIRPDFVIRSIHELPACLAAIANKE